MVISLSVLAIAHALAIVSSYKRDLREHENNEDERVVITIFTLIMVIIIIGIFAK